MKTLKSIWPVLLIAAVVLTVVPMTGCAAKNPATVVLPAGAINSTDAQINAVLQAGHAAATQYLADKKSGFTPTPALATTMTTLIHVLNIADPLYQTYHTALKTNPAAPEPANLAAAITQIQTALNNIVTITK